MLKSFKKRSKHEEFKAPIPCHHANSPFLSFAEKHKAKTRQTCLYLLHSLFRYYEANKTFFPSSGNNNKFILEKLRVSGSEINLEIQIKTNIATVECHEFQKFDEQIRTLSEQPKLKSSSTIKYLRIIRCI